MSSPCTRGAACPAWVCTRPLFVLVSLSRTGREYGLLTLDKRPVLLRQQIILVNKLILFIVVLPHDNLATVPKIHKPHPGHNRLHRRRRGAFTRQQHDGRMRPRPHERAVLGDQQPGQDALGAVGARQRRRARSNAQPALGRERAGDGGHDGAAERLRRPLLARAAVPRRRREQDHVGVSARLQGRVARGDAVQHLHVRRATGGAVVREGGGQGGRVRGEGGGREEEGAAWGRGEAGGRHFLFRGLCWWGVF